MTAAIFTSSFQHILLSNINYLLSSTASFTFLWNSQWEIYFLIYSFLKDLFISAESFIIATFDIENILGRLIFFFVNINIPFNPMLFKKKKRGNWLALQYWRNEKSKYSVFGVAFYTENEIEPVSESGEGVGRKK